MDCDSDGRGVGRLKQSRKIQRTATTWAVSVDLSVAHAIHSVAVGAKCTEPKTEALLIDPVANINTRLVSETMDVSRFWAQFQLNAIAGMPAETCIRHSLATAGCGEMQIDTVASAVTRQYNDAVAAFMSRYPKLLDQLELRAKPLKDRWGTYGIALLRSVEQLIWQNSPPDDWWAPRVSGLLVQPIRGGAGIWDAENERFWIEAMLADADPDIPEVLRIAWLITQIAIENHTRSRSNEFSLLTAWEYAAVPIVLAAAQDVELVRPGPLPIQRALLSWTSGKEAAAPKLSAWWEQWQEKQNALPLALRDLSDSLSS